MSKSAAERTQAIAERKKPCDEKAKVWMHDDWTLCEVWSVPVDALILNVENRRFAAERLWAEEELGRSLDPENYAEDELCIESLLLDKSHRVDNGIIVGSPSKDYEALKNDWERRGQETPLWIRPDGTVRNGNRRLAMIKRVQREKGDAGLNRVTAIILDPVEVDEAALLEMEQREQLTENFKVRYNDIDYLLALKEAADIRQVEWFDRESIYEVAGKLQSTVEKSTQEVVRDLYAIKYMDIFLEDREMAGQYHRLLRTLEIFRDIGRMMVLVEQDYPDDFDRVLQVLFAAVRSGKSYTHIRSIRQMFRRDRQRFDELAKTVADVETEDLDKQMPHPVPPTTDAQSDDSDEEITSDLVTSNVVSFAGPESPEIARAIDVAIDGYQSARQNDVLKTAREVVNRLQTLSGSVHDAVASSTDGSQVREVLAQIVEWADCHRELVSDNE